MERFEVLDSPQQTAKYAEYGSFMRRFGAAFIDSILLSAVQWIIMKISGVGSFQPESGMDAEEMKSALMDYYMGAMPIFTGSMIVGWLYEALMTSSAYQATVGKMALGLKVTDTEGNPISFGRATGRHFAKLISAFTLLIGYVIQPFTEKKQALHDKIAGTLVYKDAAQYRA
jgi:uncharacterized RDD family membrane protein YckC